MRKWVLFILVCFCISARQAQAQYDPSFSHYWMMEPQYNPASIGLTPNLRILGTYSSQMTGYENAPKTMYFGADMPMFFLNDHHGLGVNFLNDELGLFSHKRFNLQYSYRFNLLGGRLAIGAQADLISETLDGSKADLGETSDPVFTSSKVSGSKVDAGAGIYYLHKNWYVGASALHLTAPTVILGQTNQISIKRSYYFTAGYNIKFRNPFLTVHPSVLWKYDGNNYRTDLTARLEYANDNKMLFAGASYSPSNSVTAIVGGKFHGVVLSYSYEAYTSGIGLKNGSHEVVLSYEMKLNLYKKGRNKHKSVRLL